MTWVLVVVAITANGWQVVEDGRFENINDCFWAREYIVNEANQQLGIYNTDTPPPGMQAVCIRVPGTDT